MNFTTKNAEQKFHDLGQQLDQFDTAAMHTRMQNNLRSAWQDSHSLKPVAPMKHWKIFSYALGCSGLAVLALITTIALQPKSLPTTSKTINSALSVAAEQNIVQNTSATTMYDSTVATPTDDLLLDTDGYDQSFLNESINLSITTKADPLSMIHQLRDITSAQHGTLINIYYYGTTGAINLQLPIEQLTAFEDQLKQFDVHQNVAVESYNVTTTREDEIDAEQLVDIYITINKYKPFWENDYQQYDRSTLSGLVKYEIGQASYSVIHSSSKVLRFFIWLAIYSLVFVPAFLIIRGVIRFVIRKFKKV